MGAVAIAQFQEAISVTFRYYRILGRILWGGFSREDSLGRILSGGFSRDVEVIDKEILDRHLAVAFQYYFILQDSSGFPESGESPSSHPTEMIEMNSGPGGWGQGARGAGASPQRHLSPANQTRSNIWVSSSSPSSSSSLSIDKIQDGQIDG